MKTAALQERITDFENEVQSITGNNMLKVYVIDITEIRNDDIKSIVCKYARISLLELDSKQKGKTNVSDARMVVCYLLSTVKKLKHRQIAAIVNRDRTTVTHAINTINDRLRVKDYAVTNLVENVNKILIEQAQILSK